MSDAERIAAMQTTIGVLALEIARLRRSRDGEPRPGTAMPICVAYRDGLISDSRCRELLLEWVRGATRGEIYEQLKLARRGEP